MHQVLEQNCHFTKARCILKITMKYEKHFKNKSMYRENVYGGKIG